MNDGLTAGVRYGIFRSYCFLFGIFSILPSGGALYIMFENHVRS